MKSELWVTLDKFFFSVEVVNKWGQIGSKSVYLILWNWLYLSSFNYKCDKIRVTSYSWWFFSLFSWLHWQTRLNNTSRVETSTNQVKYTQIGKRKNPSRATHNFNVVVFILEMREIDMTNFVCLTVKQATHFIEPI